METRDLASRTLTLLFTDVEGSTRALQSLGDALYGATLDAHLRILREALSARGGRDAGSEGDAVFFAFDSAGEAVLAAVDAQRALAAYEWPPGGELRARIGLNTGDVLVSGDRHRGLAVHQTARICSAAHGGQILASSRTAEIATRRLPEGMSFRELGHYRLKDLTEPVVLFQVDVAGLQADFARPRTLDAFAHNLPIQATPVIGRVGELSEIATLVRSPDLRLVTLTGPGGIGKTRLAVQIAADVADHFEDGVWFADLTPIRDPDHVETAIRDALGRDGATEVDDLDLAKTIGGRSLLLVVDNFEQVVPAAPVVGNLLRACPRLKVLVTSRALLRLQGEREYEVPPLKVDAEEDTDPPEAVALFTQSAQAVNPMFELTAETTATVREICARLDGLPLAIELAASRTKLMSPAALLDRLASRLDVLESDRVDAPERQRTMRGAIAWSYELLDDNERRALRLMSVFRGGCTLDGAEAVAGPAETIASLVDRSLVRRTSVSDDVRFVLLETIAEFAAEKLAKSGEENDAERARAEWIGEFATKASIGLRGANQTAWLDRAERDIDNVRAALEWARGERPDLALHIVTALERFWVVRRHQDEFVPILDDLVAKTTAATPARTRALLALGKRKAFQGDENPVMTINTKERQSLHPLFEEALEIARAIDDQRLIAEASFYEALLRRSQKGVGQKHVLPQINEAIALARDSGQTDLELELRARAPTKGIRGTSAGFQQAFGTYLSDERVAAARSRGDEAAVGRLLLLQSENVFSLETDVQRQRAEESLQIGRRIGDVKLEGDSLTALGRIAVQRCEFEDARQLLFIALQHFEDADDADGQWRVLTSLSALAHRVDDRAAAREFQTRAKAIRVKRDFAYATGSALARLVKDGDLAWGLVPIAAGVGWIVSCLLLGPGRPLWAALGGASWLASGALRNLVDARTGARRRIGTHITIAPFTGLTVFFCSLSLVVGRTSVWLVPVLAVGTWRSWHRSKHVPPEVRAIGVLCGLAALLIALVHAIAPASTSTTLATALVGAYSVWIVFTGYGVRRAPVVWRLAQAGWYLYRFAWPVAVLIAIFSATDPASDVLSQWARVAAPAGVGLVMLAAIVDGERFRWPAIAILAGAALVAAGVNGSPDLLRVGGVVYGAGFVLFGLTARVAHPLMRIGPPTAPAPTEAT